MAKLVKAHEDHLHERVATILGEARGCGARSVNTSMVQAYWLIGREIVEVEQAGKGRAGYGDRLIDALSRKLAKQFGKGFGRRSLRRMRQFFLTYAHGSVLPPALGGPKKRSATLTNSDARFPPAHGWAHYLLLLGVSNSTARAFYGTCDTW